MSDFLTSLIAVVGVLGFMILIHEFGHYAVAKWLGVRVEQFAIGFGKRLIGFRKGETDYRINAIPLGGYVKMSGENPMDQRTDDPREFMNQSRWNRFLIAIAGPTMNILLAIVLLTTVYMVHYEYPAVYDEAPVIGWVLKDTAAAKAGFEVGDRITRIDDVQDPNWEQVELKEALSPGQPLSVQINRTVRRWIRRSCRRRQESIRSAMRAGLRKRAPSPSRILSAACPQKRRGSKKAIRLSRWTESPCRRWPRWPGELLFSHYRVSDGLPSNTILSIAEDYHGNLWLGTQNGLSKFTPGYKKDRNFTVSNGLQSNEFCVNACYKSHSGEMYFGGINGLNTFFPDSIKDNPYKAPTVITDFQIFNKSVSAGEKIGGHVILEKSITETKEINLSYKENVFLFEFASLHYAAPGSNQYAYRMDGFDTEWNHTDAGRRVVTYTNLSSGEYVFRVKGSNSDGVWNEEAASIRVIIAPPFWQTPWFKIILLVIIAGCVFWIYKWREIVAQQREMEELTKRELKYRNLFENSLAGMVRLSSNSWDVLEANRALLQMFGVKTSEEVKQIFETIPAADRNLILTMLKNQGTMKNFEVTVRRFDKTEACISFSGNLFSDQGYIEGVLIDVTERKRLEAKQLRAQRTESIGALASGMAHDLKNLLVPVKMAAELLKRRHDDESSRSILTSIGLNAEHSINLVQQVLAFVRGVEGKHVPLQAADLLRRVLSALRETLPSNIEIESDLRDIAAVVLGDETQLRQVLVNLIMNAKDAMPDGGHLTIVLACEQVNKVMAEAIPNALEGSFVVWSITDTGIGIPSEKIEKIFEPFYTTKEISKGTGLGLSIVAGIVKGHNGFITVESIVGKGTTFRVYLPEAQVDQPGAAI